jgi:predicted MFS family arabinose efflux permease
VDTAWRSARRGVLGAFFAFGVFWGGWAVLVPAVQDAVGASTGALGLALLGIGIGSLPAMLLAGQLIDRARFPLLPVSLAAFALVVLLPGLVHSVPALLGVLLVLGAGTGAADVAINAEAAAVERASGRRLMLLAHAFFSLGVIAGAVATGVLRQAGAARLPILALLAAGVLAAAAANRHPTARPLPHDAPASRKGLRRPLVFIGAACAAAFTVESGIENWSALYLQRELGAPSIVSAAGPAAYAAAMASGRLLGNRLRLDDRAVLGGGALLALAALLGASLAPSAPVAAAAFFVGGLGVSVAAPTLFGAAGRFGARGVATVTTIGYLGFVVGPPLVGGIAELIGLRGSFAVLAVFAALLAVATPRLALGARAAD